MTTVLVADNVDHMLNSLSRQIEQAGYTVRRATNPQEAENAFNSGEVDIGVLDLRLNDDASESDLSGIKLAKETNRRIPKIIVSSYESFEAARDVLGANLDGLPAAVAFVKKDKVATDLLPAIARAMKLKRMWAASAQNRISEQLNQDYTRARQDAVWHYWISLTISLAFVVPIVYGAIQLHGGGALSVIFTVIGVLIAEVTNYLFATKLEFLYDRVDRFHAELLQANRFEQLLEASDNVRSEAEREQFKLEILYSAASRWINATSDDVRGHTRGGKPWTSRKLTAEHSAHSLLGAEADHTSANPRGR